MYKSPQDKDSPQGVLILKRGTTAFPTGLKNEHKYGLDNGVLRSKGARGRFLLAAALCPYRLVEVEVNAKNS